jgi:hypothetical protein
VRLGVKVTESFRFAREMMILSCVVKCRGLGNQVLSCFAQRETCQLRGREGKSTFPLYETECSLQKPVMDPGLGQLTHKLHVHQSFFIFLNINLES